MGLKETTLRSQMSSNNDGDADIDAASDTAAADEDSSKWQLICSTCLLLFQVPL